MRERGAGFYHGLAIAAVVIVHRWKGNVLLSIAGGTALYMLLVQVIFA